MYQTKLLIGKKEILINATPNSSTGKSKEELLNMRFTAKSAHQWAVKKMEESRSVDDYHFWDKQIIICLSIIDNIDKHIKARFS